MAPRRYGSIDADALETRPLKAWSATADNEYPRSFEQGSSQEQQNAEAKGVVRAMRYVGMAVVCGLAIGTVTAVSPTSREYLHSQQGAVSAPSKSSGGRMAMDRDGAGATRATVGSSALSGRTGKHAAPYHHLQDHTADGGKGLSARSAHDSVRQHDALLGSSSSPLPLDFTALNFYQARDGKPAQDYPWLKNIKLIEPYRNTTLAVTYPREGIDYRWEIRAGTDLSSEADIRETGAEVVVALTKVDENVITLLEVNATDQTVERSLDETVMVKYVRREIRTLTQPDREELLDAMFEMWAVSVDDGNGKEKYGADYSDIWAINRLHFKAASPLECDHFHDGLGFLTSHSLLTNTFEYSLQQINPKLTVPYWDFTIESTASSASPILRSPIFDEEWFGTFDPADNMVKDGRWGKTKIPLMRENNPGGLEPDVYSKLRAPWNVNDRPYLTRGMGEMCGADIDVSYPWPSCSTHYALAMYQDEFYSWVWESLYDPHGPIHVWIGGVLDCGGTFSKIADLVGDVLAEKMALLAFVYRKNAFRSGYFKCEGTAQIDEASADLLQSGRCGCLDYDLTEGDEYEEVFNSFVFLNEWLGDFDADIKRQVTQTLCTGMSNDGDHLQASSSLDPTFWATHPTMERLWMFSEITGGIDELTWPDEDVTYTDDDGTVVSESLSLYGDTCEGHAGSDVFPFGLLDTDTDGFTIKTGIKENALTGNKLSNREVLKALDPRANLLTYVYDTFKWDHCALEGVNFDDAWASTESAAPETGVGGKTGTIGAKGKRTVFEEGVQRVPMYGSMKEHLAQNKASRQALLEIHQ